MGHFIALAALNELGRIIVRPLTHLSAAWSNQGSTQVVGGSIPVFCFSRDEPPPQVVPDGDDGSHVRVRRRRQQGRRQRLFQEVKALVNLSLVRHARNRHLKIFYRVFCRGSYGDHMRNY